MEIMRHMLIERIEKKVGRSLRTPRDFDFLSMRIFYDTGMQISVSTLKRTWGYVWKNNAMARRETTLNILARFVGYMDWGTFCKHSNAGGEMESDFVINSHICVSSMKVGCIIELLWHPDRMLKIRLEHDDLFTVVESVNSKLSVGDTFHIGQIIEGEPLYLRGLVHMGEDTASSYVCGRLKGVKFRVLNDSI